MYYVIFAKCLYFLKRPYFNFYIAKKKFFMQHHPRNYEEAHIPANEMLPNVRESQSLNTDWSEEELSIFLRARKMSVTPARKKLLQTFLKTDNAITYKDVEIALGDVIDRVTLYRTLQTFLKNNVIHIIPSKGGNTQYAMGERTLKPVPENEDMHRLQHLHFICKKCNAVTCLDININLRSKRELHGYDVDNVELLYYGVCKKCNYARFAHIPAYSGAPNNLGAAQHPHYPTHPHPMAHPSVPPYPPYGNNPNYAPENLSFMPVPPASYPPYANYAYNPNAPYFPYGQQGYYPVMPPPSYAPAPMNPPQDYNRSSGNSGLPDVPPSAPEQPYTLNTPESSDGLSEEKN